MWSSHPSCYLRLKKCDILLQRLLIISTRVVRRQRACTTTLVRRQRARRRPASPWQARERPWEAGGPRPEGRRRYSKLFISILTYNYEIYLHFISIVYTIVCALYRALTLSCSIYMHRCRLLVVLWSIIGIPMRFLAAEPRSAVGNLYLFPDFSGTVSVTLYLMTWYWRVIRSDLASAVIIMI